MKKINLTISIFLVSLLLFSLRTPVVISSESKDTLLKEAQILYKTDSRYVDARLQNQWKIIYSFQHPEYRKAISFEEFQYFDGHVAINYRESNNFQHISGTPTHPSVEDIKKNPIKRNPFLDIPIPPTYQLIPRSLITITGHKIEKVFVDSSGTMGKATIRLKTVQSLPPFFKSPDLKIKRDIMYIDHWEKVNGKWVVAIMKRFPELQHVSGAVTKEHPVPKDISRWDTAHFTEFNPEDLK